MADELKSIATLGTIAVRLGITARALRYYEDKGLVDVGRDRWNRRRYDAGAQARLEFVVRLRRCGLGVDVISAAIEAMAHGCSPAEALRAELQAELARLRRRRCAIEDELRAIVRTSPGAP